METTRKRRWWQFGLRWLFVATLIVAAYGAGRSHSSSEVERLNADLQRARTEFSEEMERLKGFMPELVPVQGIVLLSDGTPLASGSIEFIQTEGDFSSIGDIYSGEFELFTNIEGDGVPPGDYRVVLLDTDPAVNPRYSEKDTTELHAKVVWCGDNDFRFVLDP